MKLTPRQQEILDFIRNTLEVLGAPPTRMEDVYKRQAQVSVGYRVGW